MVSLAPEASVSVTGDRLSAHFRSKPNKKEVTGTATTMIALSNKYRKYIFTTDDIETPKTMTLINTRNVQHALNSAKAMANISSPRSPGKTVDPKCGVTTTTMRRNQWLKCRRTPNKSACRSLFSIWNQSKCNAASEIGVGAWIEWPQ